MKQYLARIGHACRGVPIFICKELKMVKKKTVTKAKEIAVPKIEEVAIPKTEETTVKKQSVQSKNQTNQSGA